MTTLHGTCETCKKPIIRINQVVIGCANLGCKVRCMHVTEAKYYREMIIEPLPLASKEGKVRINPPSSLEAAERRMSLKAPKTRMSYSISGCVGYYTMNPGGKNRLDEVLHKDSLDPEFASEVVAAKIVTSTGQSMGRLFASLDEQRIVPVKLDAFCVQEELRSFPGLVKPFQLPNDPWLYATDGMIAVRVPADAQEDPTTGRVPRGVADLPWHPPDDAKWATWPRKSHYDDDGATRQKIGDAVIDAHYDRLIRKLPAVRWTTGRKPGAAIVFRFAGGEGVLMPLAR